MKSLTAATLATIMSLGATMTLQQDEAWDLAAETNTMAQVEDLHPDLYNISNEAQDFADAIEELDNTWDDAEAQIRWWETVPVGWPVFVGTWTQVASSPENNWNGTGSLTVNADGTWDSSANEIGTAWWDGRQLVSLKRNKTD